MPKQTATHLAHLAAKWSLPPVGQPPEVYDMALSSDDEDDSSEPEAQEPAEASAPPQQPGWKAEEAAGVLVPAEVPAQPHLQDGIAAEPTDVLPPVLDVDPDSEVGLAKESSPPPSPVDREFLSSLEGQGLSNNDKVISMLMSKVGTLTEVRSSWQALENFFAERLDTVAAHLSSTLHIKANKWTELNRLFLSELDHSKHADAYSISAASILQDVATKTDDGDKTLRSPARKKGRKGKNRPL